MPVRSRLTTDIGPFTLMPEWLLRTNVSDRAIRLFAILGRYANEKGECFPGRARLASDLDTSPDSIDRALRELEGVGAMTVERRFTAQGAPTSNRYHLDFARPGGSRTGAATTRQGCGDGSRTGAAQNENHLNEKDPDQEQRRSRAATRPLDDNPRLLTKLAHTVLHERDGGRLDPIDVPEELKRRAARARIRYDGDRWRKALDAAEAQRLRMAG